MRYSDGRRLHADTVTRRFNRLVDLAGVRRIRLHDVRHTYATLSFARRVPVKVVSERLGHASVSFTQDTYMPVIPGMDEQGARIAATAILGAASAQQNVVGIDSHYNRLLKPQGKVAIPRPVRPRERSNWRSRM